MKRFLRPLLKKAQRGVRSACSRNGRLADLYFCFSPAFRDEHATTLAGQTRYEADLGEASLQSHVYRLRRNTHRIEKGLISRPRRDVFGESYLPETVDSFVVLCGKSPGPHEDLLGWSGDVLGRYFDAAPGGASAVVDRGRERWAAAAKKRERGARSPFVRDREPLRVSIDGMEQLAKRRRSVRWYEQRPVPREILDRAVRVAGQSPSACNRQPFSSASSTSPRRWPNSRRSRWAPAGSTTSSRSSW